MRGNSYGAVECAIAAIASGQHPIDLMRSLEVGIEDAGRGILGTAGELDQPIIHAAVVQAA